MKTFWKILGLGVLAAGLTPYKVEKNEETGENSYQALLWRITSAPGKGDSKRDIGINLGEGTLTSKLMGVAGKAEEPHLFSDELSVEYAAPETAEATEAEVEAVTEQAVEQAEAAEEPGKAEEVVEEIVEAVVEAVEPVESAEPVESTEPVEAAEPAEAEEPKAE